uniref:Mediator of RNA polymerase II transcription subunit 11 n=1 Tax=Eptatretus burgeri TaxID=7764 RepID=A0A8C4N8E9_EPTBU
MISQNVMDGCGRNLVDELGRKVNRTSQLDFGVGPDADPAYKWDTKRKLLSLLEVCALPSANERLRSLEEVEKEIASILQNAGFAIQELAKDKPVERQLERFYAQFHSSLSRVETELTGHIRYLTQVTTGQPHEGSSNAPRKDALMAMHRVEHTRIKLGELAQLCEQSLGPAPP